MNKESEIDLKCPKCLALSEKKVRTPINMSLITWEMHVLISRLATNKTVKEYMTFKLIEDKLIKLKNIYFKTLHVYKEKET